MLDTNAVNWATNESNWGDHLVSLQTFYSEYKQDTD